MKHQCQTEYEQFKKFIRVTASTQTLMVFANAIMSTPKQAWNLYESIATGRRIKKENKVLAKAILDYADLLEKLEIRLEKIIFQNAFQLEYISQTGKISDKEEITQNYLIIDIDGQGVLQRLLERNRKNPGEFSSILKKIWNENTQLQSYMWVKGYDPETDTQELANAM